VVICRERGADLHIAQVIPLPLNVSCSSKIQIGFTILVAAYLGSPGKRAVKRVCVCARVHNCTNALSEIDSKIRQKASDILSVLLTSDIQISVHYRPSLCAVSKACHIQQFVNERLLLGPRLGDTLSA